MLLGCAAALGLGLVLGCARAEAPARSGGPSPLAPAPAAHPERGGSAGALSLTLERAPAEVSSKAPSLEIVAPSAGQRIPSEAAARFEVGYTIDGQTARELGAPVEVVLDSYRPRRVEPGEEIRLGRLVPEDTELGSGSHRLFMVVTRGGGGPWAAAHGAGGPPFGVVHFSVGEPCGASVRRRDAPWISMLRPEGTYNGAAADHIPVELFAGMDGPGHELAIRFRVSAPGRVFTAVLRDTGRRVLSGLPSGDFEVSAALLGADGRPLAEPSARTARTITVNRDVRPSGAGRP